MAKTRERIMVEGLQQEVTMLKWHVFLDHFFITVGVIAIVLLFRGG